MNETKTEKSPAEIANDVAQKASENFLYGKLISASTQEIRQMQIGFTMMPKKDQEALLKRIDDRVRGAVKEAISVVLNHGRIEFPVSCEKVLFNSPTNAVVTVTAASHAETHRLASYAGGRTVSLVIDDLSAILNEGDSLTGQEDQKALL
jgi:hypothetical protein